MKLKRSAGWLLFILTPLLMSVRTQQADPGNTNASLSVPHTRPVSMALHQRLLADQLLVLIQQVEDWKKSSQPEGLHPGGCIAGTGNITLPMTCVVKE